MALIFVIGRNLDVGGQRPATPSLAREHVSPASSSVTAPPSGDLFADAGSPAGLRPVSLGETPLFDQAREDYQRDARSRAAGSLEAGFFIPAPTAPGSEGDLASSFSLQ